MDVLLAVQGEDATAWRAAFASALPEAKLHFAETSPRAVDYLVAWKPAPELFQRIEIRKAIFNLGAGVDALLNVSTLPRDVPIYRLEDAGMAEQMAEYVTATVLRSYREFDVYTMQQHYGIWRRRNRLAKHEFRVGILGMGLLGREVASALAAFRFPLAGWSRSPKRVADIETDTGDGELAAFLTRSRVLVCLLPSTPATRGLLNRATLSQLPAGAHLVNVSRGDLVVDGDLLALLDDGHLASATLDVFGEEPLPAGHPFWRHPKVALTPHVSAMTLIDVSATQVADKIRLLEAGKPVTGRVDAARGY